MSTALTSHIENVQAHYDLSDDFFRLFLDPTQTYSCAYFERADMTLEDAQAAKIDLALSKLGLRPGMTLLDIGCGWGATLKRAIEKYDVNVVGLTLSNNQAKHVQKMFDAMDTRRSTRVLLRDWEEFLEPVDRIVSIGAFEHFGQRRYSRFFEVAHQMLPTDGVMLLQTIVRPTFAELRWRGLDFTRELVHFGKFILDEIFPGGWLPTIATVQEHATNAGFALTGAQSLQVHYARTLDIWTAKLQANMSRAVRLQSQEVYDRYIRYLAGCARLFHDGYVDVNQFTLATNLAEPEVTAAAAKRGRQ
jgi:cyclopropane-fatty-acyl-phospholipid synthase